MKLRVLALMAVLALAPAGVHAQVPPCCAPLSRSVVDRMVPLLQAESQSGSGLDDRLAQRGMTKQDYVALKNALMVAKLDAGRPTRLSSLPFDDGSRPSRQANVAVYRANKTRIDAALLRVTPEPGCALCSAAALIPGGKAR